MKSRPKKKKSAKKNNLTHRAASVTTKSPVLINDKRLKTYIEIAPDPIIIFDNQAIVTDFNPAAEDCFGISSEIVIGRHLLELKGIPVKTLKRFKNEFSLVMSGEVKTPLDFEFKRTGLPEINLEMNYRLIQTDDQTSGLLVTLRNITERKQAELALRSERDYLDKIHDSVEEAIFTVSLPDRIIEYVNRAVEKIFGYTPEECINQNTLIFYPDKEAYINSGEILSERMRNDDDNIRIKRILKKKNGELFTAEVSSTIMRLDNGKVQLISIVRDLSDQNRAKYAIRENRERYQTFFQGSKDAIYVINVDGTFEDVNESTLELFGYTKEELLSTNVKHLYKYPADRIRFRKQIELNGSVTDFRLTLIKKSGSEIQCLLTSNIRLDEDDNIIGYQGIIRDITAKLQSEEKLHKLSNAVEQAAEIIMISDYKGVIEYVNPEFEKITGYSKNEVLGKTPQILSSGKHPKEFYRELWNIILAGETFRGLIINKKKNGEIFMEEKTISPLKDADGNITHFVSNGRDITERINAQKKIEEQRKFLRQVLDINPNIIFAKNRKGRYTLVNKAAADLADTSVKNMIGKTDYQLFHDIAGSDQAILDDKTVFETAMEKINPNTTIIDSKGNERIFYTIKRPIFDEKGNVSHVLGVSMEITEQQRTADENINLERKLERARRMESLGILAGGVAHDLNNILGPILGYPDLILEMLADDSPIREDIKMIQASAERASEVVQDLLTLARRGKYEMKPMALNNVINEYIDSSNFTLLQSRHPDVKFNAILDDNINLINGSGAHLSKTIMNLIMNAFESMHHGGTITLKTYNKTFRKNVHFLNEIPKGKYTVFEVQDTGYGISEEDLPHIFEPFYTRKEMGRSGSGLGLSVVFGVIGDHGGYIDVRTETGVGTSFYLYIPHATKDDITKKIDDTTLRGTENILVVDDGKQQRKLAKRLLSSLGYNVSTAKNGNLAVEYIKKKKIDLVILDMIMEDDFDGLDTYKEMIKIVPKQKAIIVSGYAETDRIKEAKKLGVGHYLRKPYTLKKIGSVIRFEIDNK